MASAKSLLRERMSSKVCVIAKEKVRLLPVSFPGGGSVIEEARCALIKEPRYNHSMTTEAKIEKLEAIRKEALRGRRDLHSRRHDPLFSEEYKNYGIAVDMANAAIDELVDKLYVEKLK